MLKVKQLLNFDMQCILNQIWIKGIGIESGMPDVLPVPSDAYLKERILNYVPFERFFGFFNKYPKSGNAHPIVIIINFECVFEKNTNFESILEKKV